MPRRGEKRQIESNIDPSLIPLRIIPLENQPELSEEAQAVVQLLRAHLKRAEAGKTNGVCITTDNSDETYDAEYAGTYETYPTNAIGPLEVLKLKLTRKALDGNHEL